VKASSHIQDCASIVRRPTGHGAVGAHVWIENTAVSRRLGATW